MLACRVKCVTVKYVTDRLATIKCKEIMQGKINYCFLNLLGVFVYWFCYVTSTSLKVIIVVKFIHLLF